MKQNASCIDGTDTICKKCHSKIASGPKRNRTTAAWRRAHPELARAQGRKGTLARHGMTLEEYDEMAAQQGGKCAICGSEPSGRLHVDHDHGTGRVRGLLCGGCNKSLGLMKDDPRRLLAAVEYLRRFVQ